MNDQRLGSEEKRPLSIWDFPASLMTPPHRFRTRRAKRGRERSHHAAILAFIYRNRFATASQVQRRFADILKSDRTARRHLAEMQESLGYLDLVPTPSPLWPKVYSVSWRGMRELARAFQKKHPSWTPPVNVRQRTGFSIHHVYHELACTEFLLQVYESAKNTNVELIEMQRRSLVKNDAFRLPSGSGSRLVPDGMFLLRTMHGMICTFLELDTGSMTVKAIAEKLHRYLIWAESRRGNSFVTDTYRKHGAAHPHAKFRLAIVCGGSNRSAGEKRLNSLTEIADRLPPMIRSSIWGVTTTTIRDGTNILTENIWRRIGQHGTTSDATHAFLVA